MYYILTRSSSVVGSAWCLYRNVCLQQQFLDENRMKRRGRGFNPHLDHFYQCLLDTDTSDTINSKNGGGAGDAPSPVTST